MLPELNYTFKKFLWGVLAVAQWDWWHLWSTETEGSIPGPAQWVKDVAWPLWWRRFPLTFGPAPGAGGPQSPRGTQKKKKKKNFFGFAFLLTTSLQINL